MLYNLRQDIPQTNMLQTYTKVTRNSTNAVKPPCPCAATVRRSHGNSHKAGQVIIPDDIHMTRDTRQRHQRPSRTANVFRVKLCYMV